MKRNLSRARSNRGGWVVSAVAFMFITRCCARQPHHLRTLNEPSSAPGRPSASSTSARLNINAASARELEHLPGVGEVLASRIVAYRQQYGPFRRVEHLLMVPGFSDHKFRELRELITVE